ncbi:hypothetical protein [Flavisolibacter tropicus]|uniref:hypothetical protein n=1 Tax=Flavisolibacter tropicus TaxID=1492898 RepID=UPI0011E00551|nr:hypothetical protein [Flavisolibacter tropicus]
MYFVTSHFHPFMESGIYLTRNEVIKRYRGCRHFNPYLLQQLLMYSFCFVYKSENGEVSVV